MQMSSKSKGDTNKRKGLRNRQRKTEEYSSQNNPLSSLRGGESSGNCKKARGKSKQKQKEKEGTQEVWRDPKPLEPTFDILSNLISLSQYHTPQSDQPLFALPPFFISFISLQNALKIRGLGTQGGWAACFLLLEAYSYLSAPSKHCL